MKKSDRIIAILTETPDLTVEEIAAKAGEDPGKTSGLVSLLKGAGTLESKPNPAGGRAKIYCVAGAGSTAGKPAKKKTNKQPAKKAAKADPVQQPVDNFIVAITYDHRLICIERSTGNVHEYSPERTNAIADLIMQQFDA